MRARRTTVALGLVIGLLAAAGLVTAGCASDPTLGWSTTSTYSDAVSSVAVPIARNDSFHRGVEFDLTEALIKAIESRTPYKVTETARADSILSVRIRRVDLDQISTSRLSGLGEEVLVGVSIDFEWRELDTGRRLLEREDFQGHGLFLPSRPTSERIDIGRRAVVESLAKDVVDEMRSSW